MVGALDTGVSEASHVCANEISEPSRPPTSGTVTTGSVPALPSLPEAFNGIAARVREQRRWRADNSSVFSTLCLDIVGGRACSGSTVKAVCGKMRAVVPDQGLRPELKFVKGLPGKSSMSSVDTALPTDSDTDGPYNSDCGNSVTDSSSISGRSRTDSVGLTKTAAATSSCSRSRSSSSSSSNFNHARRWLLAMRPLDCTKPKELVGFSASRCPQAAVTAARPPRQAASDLVPATMPMTMVPLSGELARTQQQLIQRMHDEFAPSSAVAREQPHQQKQQKQQQPQTASGRRRGGRGLARAGSDSTAGGSPATTLPVVRTASGPARQIAAAGTDEDVKRSVQSLLNKVCPENVGTILEKIAALNVKETNELAILVELIFKKALAEPHYCETYADLVFGLQTVLPEFARRSSATPPSTGVAAADGTPTISSSADASSPAATPPLTLRTALLSVCQREFEGLLAAMDGDGTAGTQDQEELEHLRNERRNRLRANVRLIGHLFLRKLLATKVVGQLCCELTNCHNQEHVPEEHAIECACELLMSVGYTLESNSNGAAIVQKVCERMRHLKERRMDVGGKRGLYCKRVEFIIQDLLETRAAGWAKRSFKTAAKTKEEIRKQQEQEEIMAKTPTGRADAPGAEQVVLGQRPAYLSAVVAGG